MQRFEAPWDRSLRTTTWFLCAVLGVLGVGLPAITGAAVGEWPVFLTALLGVLFGGIVAAAAALAPRAFSIGNGVLRVERAVVPVSVSLRAIRAVGPLPDDALRGSMRVAGSGGFFGYYGRFWSRALGSYRLYATRGDGLVRVDTDRERYVLSPRDPERFVAALLAAAPGARASAELGEPPAGVPARTRRWLDAAPLLALGLAVVGIGGAFAGALALAPEGVAVRADAVVIARRWAGPVEIPTASIRDVLPVAPAALEGARRVNGVAGIGAIAYGRFRSPALGAYRLYRWRRGPHVLLETEDGRVVLTPDDPDRFVTDVRAALPP